MKPLALIFNNAKASKLLVLRKDGPVDANGPPILLKPHFFSLVALLKKIHSPCRVVSYYRTANLSLEKIL